jgi:isopentenyl-diphosphate Delta-isomerase
MTGGVREATVVNERLTRAAAEHGVAMTLGSGRALLEDPSLLHTYVGTAPESRPPLLLANLGAAQLGGADGPARAERSSNS